MAALDERAEVVDTDRGIVQVARDGAGPPVLVIHGGPGGFDQGLSLGRHFVEAGCEVVAPSRPGYLRTPLESGRTPDEQADLYAAMLTTIGVDRVSVLGVSSGGPSAVHFAARHPQRTTVLMLDSAVLLPFEFATSRLERTLFLSRVGVWALYQFAARWPGLIASIIADSFSTGFDKHQKKQAAEWIRSDPDRRRAAADLVTTLAPREFRAPGQANDETTEPGLPPLPFAEVVAPTLIAHGTNDGIVPVEHSTNASHRIDASELMLIEEGHHALPLCRHYPPLARRQIELALA